MLRDLACVLLDLKFIEQLIHPEENQLVLTIQQCRILLTDIACCSLMRLDITSMDKLWDLMVMLFKWQLSHANNDPQKLLDITFRHMDGVGKLMPEMRKTIIIDAAKRHLMEFWDLQTADSRLHILMTIQQWLQIFHVKISILIRLGFQRADGTFETDPDCLDIDLYQSYVEYIGENVYARNGALREGEKARKNMAFGTCEIQSATSTTYSHELHSLVDQLSIQPKSTASNENDDANTAAVSFKSNMLLLDEVNCSMNDELDADENEKPADTDSGGIVHIEHTQSTLQKYLNQFRMENETDPVDESPGSKDDSTPFDATEELLKMLDRD